MYGGFLGVVAGAPLGLVAPVVGAITEVVAATWAVLLNRHAQKMMRVVRDPPDRDFRTVTVLGQMPIDLERLGGDEFGRISQPAIERLLAASAEASAMIRALERSQGAAIAGEPGVEAERFAEALRFAAGLGRELVAFADLVVPVVDRLSGPSGLPLRGPAGGKLLDLLDPATLAELYRMGVPRRLLDLPIRERVNNDPQVLFARELAALASASRRYGELLLAGSSETFS